MQSTAQNIFFDQWLNKKVAEILVKLGKEKISTDEMIILILSSQSQYFHKKNIELGKEIESIKNNFNICS